MSVSPSEYKKSILNNEILILNFELYKVYYMVKIDYYKKFYFNLTILYAIMFKMEEIACRTTGYPMR